MAFVRKLAPRRWPTVQIKAAERQREDCSAGGAGWTCVEVCRTSYLLGAQLETGEIHKCIGDEDVAVFLC